MYDKNKKSYLDNKTGTKYDYYYEPTIKTARNETKLTDKEIIELQTAAINGFLEKQQQLISFLEDKIKEYKEYIDTYKKEKIGNCKLYCEAKLFVYQEVLDFVNKGGKDD